MEELVRKLTTEQKTHLSNKLLMGHKRFGPVLERRPYKDDEDDTGGTGAPSILKEHPLLAEQPVGATSDLSHIATMNQEAEDQLDKRNDEVSPQLKQQLQQKQQLTHAKKNEHLSRPSPLGN